MCVKDSLQLLFVYLFLTVIYYSYTIEAIGVMHTNTLGYLKLNIRRANFFCPLEGRVHVDITISNHSIVQKGGQKDKLLQIHRHTDSIAGQKPVWNECIEVRCALGWDVKLVVIVGNKHNEKRYDVDNLAIGTCTSGVYYIREVSSEAANCIAMTPSEGQHRVRRNEHSH